MTRRAFFMTLIGVPMTGTTVPNSGTGGFIVSGLVTATDTDRAEGFIGIGQDVALVVRDQAIYDREIAPLIGKIAELTLWEKT